MLHIPFFHRQEPAADLPQRSASGQFTLSPKSRARLNRRASINCQLGVYVATTTREQRLAETEAFIAKARETQEQKFQRILAAGQFDGLWKGRA